MSQIQTDLNHDGFKLISIVIPAFNEAENIETALAKIEEQIQSLQYRYELIVVDDGSVDMTWEKLSRLQTNNDKIRAFRFSRNFGKEAALRAGLNYALGDAIIFIDADLQHPPTLLPQLIDQWQKRDLDIVEASKRYRGKESPFHLVSAKLFYRIIKRLSGFELQGSSDYKLISRRIAEILKAMPEVDFFFRGICVWVGFNRSTVTFDVPAGARKESRWTLYKKAQLFFSGIVSLSSLPLHFVTLSGIFFFLFSVALALQTLYMKFSGKGVDGFTTVILLQLIIGSILMIGLGVVGLYLSTIYNEVKKRPTYIITSSLEKQA